MNDNVLSREFGVLVDDGGSIEYSGDAENARAMARDFGGAPVDVTVRLLPHDPSRDAKPYPFTIDRVDTPEQLEELPDGTVYLSDGHGLPEYKVNGNWYVVGSDQPFEPELPGTIHVPEPK